MATYVIGDIQGCFRELETLLTKIAYTSDDTLWFVGDIINRGPHSLETLRLVRSLSNAKMVLGNHDIHLLATACGVRPLKELDTLQPILDAPDCNELIDWLRKQPLIIYNKTLHAILVHAGIPPCWDLSTAMQQAQIVEQQLQQSNYTDFLKQAFGNAPACWSSNLPAIEQQRFTINALTRMRYCSAPNCLDLQFDGPIGSQPSHLNPWFAMPQMIDPTLSIYFGHWAALQGKTDTPQRYALDTGCVWGKTLTALRIEDKMYFHVDSSLPKIKFE